MAATVASSVNSDYKFFTDFTRVYEAIPEGAKLEDGDPMVKFLAISKVGTVAHMLQDPAQAALLSLGALVDHVMLKIPVEYNRNDIMPKLPKLSYAYYVYDNEKCDAAATSALLPLLFGTRWSSLILLNGYVMKRTPLA